MSLLMLFEVMDKEASLEFIVLYFPLLGVFGFLLTRWHPALLVLPYIFVLIFAAEILSEVNDPFVGPAIINEAGYIYVVLSYISIAIGLLLPLAGIPAWVIRRRRK